MQIMAILNLTPDSFHDGGRAGSPESAIAAARQMHEDGAHIIDLGAESTRPGATPVRPETEQARLLPVLRQLVQDGIPTSIDTRNAATMAACLAAGATMINDVSALRHDPAAAALLAGHTCRVVLMHMRGTPETMHRHATYANVVDDVARELAGRRAAAIAAGIHPGRIILDPGLGFAKTAAQNITLLANLALLLALGSPLLIGASRKRFLGGAHSNDRLGGSIAVALHAAAHGAAFIRVHDVPETVQALTLAARLALG